MSGSIPRSAVRHRPHYLEEHDLVYLANPKCASSSIKLALREAAGEENIEPSRIHAIKDSSFVDNMLDIESYDSARLGSAAVFSVIRNPYTRVVSGYVDKVKNAGITWQNFCARIEIEPKRLSFTEFLRVIKQLEPIDIDPHFRPQWLNVLYPTRGTALLKMEDPESITRFLQGRGITWPRHARPPRRRSLPLENFYDAVTEALVRDIYADDFRYFGYSTSLDLADTPGEPPMLPADAPTILERVMDAAARTGKGRRLARDQRTAIGQHVRSIGS